MQRYFLSNEQMSETRVTIHGEDAAHIVKVMRLAPGDFIICVNEQERAVRVALTTSTIEVVEGKIVEEINQIVELPVYVTVAQGLPKGDKLEWIVQKTTELGVHAIVPFVAARSIVKWDEKKASKKTARLQKIAKEAAEQAQRTRIPVIASHITFTRLTRSVSEYDVCIICDEEEAKTGERSTLKRVLEQLKDGMSVLIVIGPEGGLTREEVTQLKEANAVSCALGPRIVRTETASLYLLGALSYQFE